MNGLLPFVGPVRNAPSLLVLRRSKVQIDRVTILFEKIRLDECVDNRHEVDYEDTNDHDGQIVVMIRCNV